MTPPIRHRTPEGMNEEIQLMLFPVLWDHFVRRCKRHAELCKTHLDLALKLEQAYHPEEWGLCSKCLKQVDAAHIHNGDCKDKEGE